MNIPLIHLTEEERFVALTQIYMELELPLAAAVDAANADLRSLDGGGEVVVNDGSGKTQIWERAQTSREENSF